MYHRFLEYRHTQNFIYPRKSKGNQNFEQWSTIKEYDLKTDRLLPSVKASIYIKYKEKDPRKTAGRT